MDPDERVRIGHTVADVIKSFDTHTHTHTHALKKNLKLVEARGKFKQGNQVFMYLKGCY